LPPAGKNEIWPSSIGLPSYVTVPLTDSPPPHPTSSGKNTTNNDAFMNPPRKNGTLEA
jgi:hypothetical protein